MKFNVNLDLEVLAFEVLDPEIFNGRGVNLEPCGEGGEVGNFSLPDVGATGHDDVAGRA